MNGKTLQNKVIYYTAPGKVELTSEPCPLPGEGEVRCKAICSLVSIGTEMICLARDVDPGSVWDEWIKYPFEPGYSLVGKVIDIGDGVSGISAGDIICSPAPHRAFFIDRPENLYHVPEGLTAEEAVWFELNVIVQNGVREVSPVLGETAVVIGLGPLGQLAVRFLGLTGLSNLVAIDPLKERCEMADGNGPTEIFCLQADKAFERVYELTVGKGADIVFDLTGNPAVFHSAQHMLRKRGRLGLIGDVPRPSMQNLTHDVVSKSLSIIASHGSTPPPEGNCYYRWGRKELIDFFFNMILSGRIRVNNLITHRINPEEAPTVYQDILKNRSSYVGVVIDWENI